MKSYFLLISASLLAMIACKPTNTSDVNASAVAGSAKMDDNARRVCEDFRLTIGAAGDARWEGRRKVCTVTVYPPPGCLAQGRGVDGISEYKIDAKGNMVFIRTVQEKDCIRN